MVVAFITGTYAVLGGHSPGIVIASCVLGCIFFSVFANSLLSIERKILNAPHFLDDMVGDFKLLTDYSMDSSNSTGQIESAAPLPLASPGVDCQATQQADQTKEEPTEGIDLDVFNAAKQGNVDALREHGEHLDIKLTATKNTVLHIYIACSSSPTFNESEKQVIESTNIVEDILKTCPALLLQQNESGETALHIAARHGRAGIVGALIRAAKARHDDLEKGVLSEEAWKMLIRATNNGKDTALHEAVRFNHFAVVEILTREDPESVHG
ncbi:hypothetical protein COP2_018624 [Malus domestica]|uniref:Uncharacterized protein n=1 Tax=Malus domestica TaxID=3750 RepID=A0A498I0G6_MALDO|nr:hypothetical protein DVH24_029632 [Malus domestica]